LEAVVPLIGKDGLEEIIFVDDGSTDETAVIVRQFPVRYIAGNGRGPGSARNIGWQAATNPIVWFIDSDCVAEPNALHWLLPHLEDPSVAGVGGSYENMCPDSLLACLIHEEIIERHRSMEKNVNYLGSFNVLYRRQILEGVGGFDERHFNGPGSPGAEDIELAYRIHDTGYDLLFEPRSHVRHFHPTSMRRYLRAQRHHGYWRAQLYLRHPTKMTGDAYSSTVDHAQPPVATLVLTSLPFLAYSPVRLAASGLVLSLALLQVPMTRRLLRRTGKWQYAFFPPMGMIRAFARGVGMTTGLFAAMGSQLRGRD
jgi:cellulose synthase/poly-beta-1,6-N-acetylglucosamine synthase-like glycosyltransferase